MSFFENVSDKFFNPFCCRNRELYFACIQQLIDKSKEIPVLYEADARNCLIIYLQNCKYAIETENIGEEISSQRTDPENASVILHYFRRCGWITPKEIGRSGDNIASVSSYCRKLVEALHKIFDRDASGAITNHIFSMYEILKSSLEKDSVRAIRPYSNICIPLIENECDLKNELLTLKDSIRTIMHTVMKLEDANKFGQFLMRDQVLDRFFNDYFFIKRSGLIPGYIAGIDRMLRKIRRSELYERMAKEYVEQKNVDLVTAQDIIDRQFSELDSFINMEYEKEISYIDRKINLYYNLYSTRMMMVLSNRTNLQNYLNQLLLRLRSMEASEREEFLGRLPECFKLRSMGYVGRKSFERRKKANPNTDNTAIRIEELSQEEKQRLTDEILKEAPDRYSMENVRDYFDGLAIPDEGLGTGEMAIHSRDDAMMMAASIIYSDSAGFPYGVEFGEGMAETEVARISNIRIRKRGQKGLYE